MLDAAQLFTRILRFLSLRPRSQHEIKLRLARYGATPEQVTAIIAKLTSLHFLDDEAFAHYLVDSRRAQGRSSRLIASELGRHGFDRETVSLFTTNPTADQLTLQELIAKKSHLPREKLIAYLARRGFAWDLIKEGLMEYNSHINRNS